MPEQEMKAGELNKSEQVLDVVLPSGYEAAESGLAMLTPIAAFGD